MSITLQDIANYAGVSNATVSRVVNNPISVTIKTREKVLRVIEKFNYVPNAIARSLSRNETNTIGIIVPDITNPFFGKIIRGISTILREKDYNIVMCDTDENIINEDNSIQMLKELHVRGLIITPTIEQEKTNNLKLMNIEQSGIPVVLVDRDTNSSNLDGVFLDNIKAGLDVTQSFINAGHKKIATILGPTDSKASIERALGYRQALEMNGINIDPSYILNGWSYSMECGYEMTKKLFELDEPPTAIFIGSSILSQACINALLDSNIKIPQDMAIIGFGEIPYMKTFGTNISYIERYVREMGEYAANLLIDRIENPKQGQSVCKRIIIPPKLVLNGSELYCN